VVENFRVDIFPEYSASKSRSRHGKQRGDGKAQDRNGTSWPYRVRPLHCVIHVRTAPSDRFINGQHREHDRDDCSRDLDASFRLLLLPPMIGRCQIKNQPGARKKAKRPSVPTVWLMRRSLGTEPQHIHERGCHRTASRDLVILARHLCRRNMATDKHQMRNQPTIMVNGVVRCIRVYMAGTITSVAAAFSQFLRIERIVPSSTHRALQISGFSGPAPFRIIQTSNRPS
jgi:hypothetical protein